MTPFIRAAWIQHPSTDGDTLGRPYRVFPKPFPVIGFQIRGRLAVRLGESEQLLAPSGITGMQPRFREFVPERDTRSVLITLQPWGAFTLLGGCPMSDLAGAHLALDGFLPAARIRQIEDELANADSAPGAADILRRFFLPSAGGAKRLPHPAVVVAAERILATHGTTPIARLLSDLALSRRQQERLFLAQVGAGPKELASMARFAWALAHLTRRRSWADLAFTAGYADQPHFIRSFRLRAGAAPQRFLESHGTGGSVAFLQ